MIHSRGGVHRGFSVETEKFRNSFPRGDDNFIFGLEFSCLEV